MSGPQPSLLPGQSPPYFVVTPTDQAGVIVNVAGFCLVLAAISIGIRAYVRFVLVQQRLAWDDSTVLLALVFYIIQSALVFRELRDGLGKTVQSLTDDQIVTQQKYLYADDIFYVISVWISKVAFVLLFARTSPKKEFQRITQALIGFVAVTGIVSILLITIRCDLSRPWIWFRFDSTTCTDLTTKWQAIAALDIITEVLLSSMSIYLVWSLQLDFSRKAVVIFAFSLRLAIIAPIVCHLHYVGYAVRSNDPSLRATSFVLCKQVEISYAIIAASIPVMRPFIIATTTNYGGAAEGPKGHSGSQNTAITFGLSKLSRRSHSNNHSQNRTRAEDDEILLNGNTAHTSVSAGYKRDGTSAGSNDSERMIIRKDIQYSVDYDRTKAAHGAEDRGSEDAASGSW